MKMKHQGPSAYTVYATSPLRMAWVNAKPDLYCGSFDTLDEARECVKALDLASWEIWLGDRIVDESHHHSNVEG